MKTKPDCSRCNDTGLRRVDSTTLEPCDCPAYADRPKPTKKGWPSWMRPAGHSLCSSTMRDMDGGDLVVGGAS